MLENSTCYNECMNAHDRCDRCGAQAYVVVTVNNGPLMFCSHHYDEYSPVFPDYAIMSEDNRKALVSA